MKKKMISKVLSMALAFTLLVGGSGTAFASWTDDISASRTYSAQFDTADELMAYDAALNIEIAKEGFVLLKNNGALPLAKDERMVTVLGSEADTISTSGTGSGSQERPGVVMGSDYAAEEAATLFQSLEAVGITANPRVRERYLTVNPLTISGSTGNFGSIYSEGGHYMDLAEDGAVEFDGQGYNPITDGTGSLDGVDDLYSLYGDAAIVVLVREGSEGADNPSNNVEGHSDPTDHYFMLSDSEKELIAYAKYHFSKVIVILNTPGVMEIGALEDDEEIDAIIWAAQAGWNGIMALGEILVGNVNPSGHVVDFWMRDFESDPTWYNFGNYSTASYIVNGTYETDYITTGNTTVQMGKDVTSEYTNTEYVSDYAEGIFMGYRYYETVAADLGEAGEAWYQSVTTYPFGHGLSYTTFTQSIEEVEGNLNDPDGEIVVTVKVTNTGKVAGKEVVQLYSTPPYFEGEIDKAAVNLVDFTKTQLLESGESETVQLTIAVKDLASFDYNDANGNGFEGYELEAGDYILSIRANSHDMLDERVLTAEIGLTWDEDGNPDTPNNIFSQDVDSVWGQYNTLAHTWTESGEDHYLTRSQLIDGDGAADLTGLAWLVTDDNLFTDMAFGILDTRTQVFSYEDYDDVKTPEVETDYENVWVRTEEDIPSTWTQGTGVLDENGQYALIVTDMKGVAYDDPQWDEFINQLTWEEVATIASNINDGSYHTSHLDSIGLKSVVDEDGPGQLRKAGDWAWVCAVVVASTWNVDLAYKNGAAVGNATMLGGVNGWYGPGVNIHRNPLSGRNFEYYSQDGIQGGMIAAAVVKGAVDMGCHVYVKHAFMNDQETNRENTSTFATEQAIREIYAKVFELCVKEGNANGLMSSFNRIGLETSAGYAINQQLYRNEWGFEGYSVTDMYFPTTCGWMGNTLVRGNTMALGSYTNSEAGNGTGLDGAWDAEANMVTVPIYDEATGRVSETERMDSPTLWYWTRDLVKNILFLQANMNGQDGLYSYMIEANDSLVIKQNAALPENANILSDDSRAQLTEVFGATGYNVTVDELPAGLELVCDVTGRSDGTLTGTPKTNGTYHVTVTITGNYGMSYISDNKTFTLDIKEFDEIILDGVTLSNARAELGVAYEGQVNASVLNFTAENYVENGQASAETKGKYVGLTYSAEGLPAGLNIDENTGVITGVPSETGVFAVQITANYQKVAEVQFGGGPGGGGPGGAGGAGGPGGGGAGGDDASFGGSAGGGAPGGAGGAAPSGRTSYQVQAESYTSIYRFEVEGGFNVHFDANNGSSDVQNVGMTAPGELGNILGGVSTPVNGAKTFLGWATVPGADAPDVTEKMLIDGETTLYAVYSPEPLAIGENGNWFINGVDSGISAK